MDITLKILSYPFWCLIFACILFQDYEDIGINVRDAGGSTSGRQGFQNRPTHKILHFRVFLSGLWIPDDRFRKIAENKCKEEIKYGNVDAENPTKWMAWSGQSRNSTIIDSIEINEILEIKKPRNRLSFGLKRKHVIQNVN